MNTDSDAPPPTEQHAIDTSTIPAPLVPLRERRALARTAEQKLDLILDRLEEGEDRFARIEAQREEDNERYRIQDAINLRFMHSINLAMKRYTEAAEVETESERRYPRSAPNGADQYERTNPINERPSSPPSQDPELS